VLTSCPVDQEMAAPTQTCDRQVQAALPAWCTMHCGVPACAEPLLKLGSAHGSFSGARYTLMMAEPMLQHQVAGMRTMTSPSRRICSAQLAMMIPTRRDISRQPSTTAARTPCSQSGRHPSSGSRYTCHTALAEAAEYTARGTKQKQHSSQHSICARPQQVGRFAAL
jgi:hypothetical protein